MAYTSSPTARRALHDTSYPLSEKHEPVMTRILGRAALAKRDMDGGAIAGTVVGVVVFVFALALCLYPLVIRRVRKRRQQRKRAAQGQSNDPEAGVSPDAEPGAQSYGGERRLSSTDSVKPIGAYAARGTFGPEPPFAHLPADATEAQTYNQNDPASFSGYNGAYYPGGDPSEPRGANADYYSPSIPSEAFGGLPGNTQKDFEDFQKSTNRSRGNSLSQSIRNVFRKGSGRTDSWRTNPVVAVPESAADQQVFTYASEGTHSPGPVSPVNATSHSSMALDNAKQPSQSPPLAQRGFHAAPTPLNPAPGTVNPMSIMAASTDAERVYRTDYELHNLSNPPQHTDFPTETEGVETSALPDSLGPQYDSPPEIVATQDPDHHPHLSVEDAHLARQDTDQTLKAHALSSHEDASMGPIPVPHTAQPDTDANNASYSSHPDTPAIGFSSMTPSSQMSPYSTTENETSPDSSGIHSDFQHSMSPASGGPSPRPGQASRYPCDMPGCKLAFDQMHKLNHHQRYHNKEHKCHYPGCDKGFGTKTHLERHINDRHEKTKKYHCAVQGCDYTRVGGKSFSRKDNWKRHMIKYHNVDRTNLPEPDEVDAAMSGT